MSHWTVITPSPVSYTAHIHYLTYSKHRKNQRTCKGTPSRFPGTKGSKMAGSEPLIQEAVQKKLINKF